MSDTETLPEDEELDIVQEQPEGETVDTEASEREDERLAGEDPDADDSAAPDDLTAAKREKRHRRREMRKKAQTALESEVSELRQLVPFLVEKVRSLEGHAVSTTEQGIDAQIAQKLAGIRTAEQVIAKAIEEGNGSDFAEANRYRDQFRDELNDLTARKSQFTSSREQPAQDHDPIVVGHAQKFLRENSDWYDPQLGNEESRQARMIDQEILRAGYDPRTPAYWNELQRRCDALFEDSAPASPPRKKAPPQGTTREAAPSSGKQFLLSAERVAAMKEMGVWDDPKQRQEWAKHYQDYDRQRQRA